MLKHLIGMELLCLVSIRDDHSSHYEWTFCMVKEVDEFRALVEYQDCHKDCEEWCNLDEIAIPLSAVTPLNEAMNQDFLENIAEI